MKLNLWSLLNLRKILQARRFSKEQKKYDRSQYDLELFLYSRILSNDMLHYGFFQQTDVAADSISIADFERAQDQYAIKILAALNPEEQSRVMDSGCGMGGLTSKLLKRGFEVTSLTPNNHQIEHIKKTYQAAKTVHSRYEICSTEVNFDAIIHAESLQYIPLSEAFSKTHKLLSKNGLWIICDYFSRRENPRHKSGHFIDDFESSIESHDWKVLQEEDITENVLPTLRFAKFYVDRFLFPLKHFGEEKLRFKAPFWYAMSRDLRLGIQDKIDKEIASIDPDLFREEKVYKLFVLQKI